MQGPLLLLQLQVQVRVLLPMLPMLMEQRAPLLPPGHPSRDAIFTETADDTRVTGSAACCQEETGPSGSTTSPRRDRVVLGEIGESC